MPKFDISINAELVISWRGITDTISQREVYLSQIVCTYVMKEVVKPYHF